MVSPGVDLIDQDHYASQGPPHATLRRLRADAPVSWHEMPDDTGFWAITKYKDIFAISLDQKTFSSARAGVILRNWKEGEYEPQKGMLVNLDPPESDLTPLDPRELVAAVTGQATPLMAQAAARRHHRSVPLPAPGITSTSRRSQSSSAARDRRAGQVPTADRHRVSVEQPDVAYAAIPEYRLDPDTRIAPSELFMHANSWPPDAASAGICERADYGEVRATGSRSRSSTVLHAPARRRQRDDREPDLRRPAGAVEAPEERARCDGSTLLPTAVEMLRWVTLNLFLRTATRDVEVRGQKIREGDKVVLFYASANRDEEMFPDPDRFDVGRQPNDHLAFGIGPHFCLGANLARLEIRVMFEELLRRLPDIALAGPVERLRSNFINGIKRMP
jgi:cholest-4-en-3-one 26-monooxygenase